MKYDSANLAEAEAFPVILTLELSEKCNLRCTFCHLSIFEPDTVHQVSYEQFEEHFVPALSRIKSLTLHDKFEPLTCRDFVPIFRKISEFDIETYFSSNGILLTDKVLDVLVGNLTFLTVSITGFTPEHYKKHMGYDGLGKVDENLTRLNELKKARGTKYPILRISTVGMLDAIEELEMAIDFAKKHEAEEGVQLTFFRAMDDALDDQRPIHDEERFTAVTNHAKAYAEAQGVKLFLQSGELDVNRKETEALGHRFCRLPWNGLTIQPDGNVYPCPVANTHLGNVFEQSIEDIWNGETLRQFRAHVNDPLDMNEDCRTCHHCRIGSAVRKETTDLSYKEDYLRLERKD